MSQYYKKLHCRSECYETTSCILTLQELFNGIKSATLERCGGLGDLIVIKQNKLKQMETNKTTYLRK